MSVSAEIAQHMFRSTEGPLGIDDPVLAEQHTQPGPERTRLGQKQQATVELEITSMECVAKSGDELAAEDTAEHADGQEDQDTNSGILTLTFYLAYCTMRGMR